MLACAVRAAERSVRHALSLSLSLARDASELDEKLRDYRLAGTSLVWVVDPATRLVWVRSAGAAERWIDESGELDGDTVLPGFSVPVKKLFARLARVPV